MATATRETEENPNVARAEDFAVEDALALAEVVLPAPVPEMT